MTAIAATYLPPRVQSYLRRYALRRRFQRLVRRVGLALLITLVWSLICCLIDRQFALSSQIRLGLLVANGFFVAMIILPSVIRLLGRMEWLRVAREVEKREPDWRERLVTVASNPAGSRDLIAVLAADVEAEAARRKPTDLLPWAPALRPWTVSLVVGAGISTLAFAPTLDLPRLVRRYFTPLAPVAPAATTRLFVTPGDTKIAAGEPLRVRCAVQRMDDVTTTLHIRRAGSESEDWIEQPMTATSQGAFEGRVSGVENDLDYFVTGGDARSDVFRATVLRRPAVVTFNIKYEYPPYLKLPPRLINNDDGVIEAPAGTEVTIDIESSERLSSAQLMMTAQALPTAPTARPNVRQAKIVLRDPHPLTVRMVSSAGVEGHFTGGRIRPLGDRPPVVVLTTSGQPGRLKYQAADDFALARLDAEITTANDRKKIVALPLRAGPREQTGVLALDAAALDLPADETVQVQLRAEDRAGQFTLTRPVPATLAPAAPTPTSAPGTSEADASQTLDLQGFDDQLNAYFEAIKKSP